jgi:hypothetical protein
MDNIKPNNIPSHFDPTVLKRNRQAPPSPKALSRVRNFFDKLIRAVWYAIIIFLVVQGIFIGVKIFAKQPNERMCWDVGMCFNYCYNLKQSICLVPDRLDTENYDEAFKLLLTGKRNIVEVLNVQQGYCACQYGNGEKRTDTFYRFYSENK